MSKYTMYPKVTLEGDNDPATSTGTDLAVWSPDPQQQQHSLCLAFHHLQLTPGSILYTPIISHSYRMNTLQTVCVNMRAGSSRVLKD